MSDDKIIIGEISYQDKDDLYLLRLNESSINNSRVVNSCSAESTNLDNFIDQCKEMFPDAVMMIRQSAIDKVQAKEPSLPLSLEKKSNYYT